MNATEIERAVVGLVMRDQKAVAEAVSLGVERKHFQDPLAGAAYQAVIEIWRKGQTPDLFTVGHIIGAEKRDEISAMRKAAPLTANTRVFFRALVDNYRGTELFHRLADVAKQIQTRRPLDPLDPIVEQLGSLLTFSAGASAAIETVRLSDALKKTLGIIEDRVTQSTQGKLPGVPSGFQALDEVVYGFQPRKMYVLGARTSVGKTTMATTMAVNAARAGHKVAIVSVEMDETDMAEKMLSRAAKVALSRLSLGDLAEGDVDRIAVGAGELDTLPLFITTVKKPQLDLLALELTRLVKVEGVEFIIVDYLQQFETGEELSKRMTARDTAKGVSVAMQSLAKTLGVPILVLSQLNREAPEEGEPDLRHIAETDQIARDADVVMFLYRYEGRHFLSVAKQRRGKTKCIKLDARLDFSSFEEAMRDGTK